MAKKEKDIKDMSLDELTDSLNSLKKEVFNIGIQKMAGQFEDTSQISKKKKSIRSPSEECNREKENQSPEKEEDNTRTIETPTTPKNTPEKDVSANDSKENSFRSDETVAKTKSLEKRNSMKRRNSKKPSNETQDEESEAGTACSDVSPVLAKKRMDK